MTGAQRGTWLVIAVLAAATAVVWAGLAARPAGAGEAQDFWREQLRLAPRHITTRIRLHRASLRFPGAVRARPAARDDADTSRGSRVAGPVPATNSRIRVVGAHLFPGAFVMRHARVTPAEQTPAAFADRAALPDFNLPLSPFFVPIERAPEFPRPQPRPPSNNSTRMLCVAAVFVVAIAGGLISHFTTERGHRHAS